MPNNSNQNTFQIEDYASSRIPRSSYHEQLHHDILVDITRPVLVIVCYDAVVVIAVSVLQAKHSRQVGRQLRDCNLTMTH